MKKFLLFIFAIAVANLALADYTGSGYYRVQNKVTERYIRVIDNRGSVNLSTTEADLGALETKKYFENVVSDPASIIYITPAGDGYNFKAQGTSSYSIIGYYVKLYDNKNGTYKAYASHSGLTKYLCDENTTFDEGVVLTNSNKTRDWYIKPVDQNDGQYFAFKPTVTAGGQHYTTIYAAFPFTLPADMTAYYVSTVADGQAVWKEVKDGKVPASTPVYVKCKSSNYVDNKITIGDNGAASLSGNLMKGVYFNNGTKKHNNQLAYDAKTMRILGTMSDGSLGFITANINFIPANTAYLVVPANSPAEIKLVSESEFKPNIAVKSVSLSKSTLSMYTGDSHTLTASINPDNASDQSLKWSSSNTKVATVDANGVVKATGYGKATITVTSVANSAAKATCEVNVLDHCTGVKLSATSAELYVGETFTLTGYTLPQSTSDGKIEWSVSDEKIIKRNNDGTVRALAEGVAEVIAKATDGGHTAKCTVTVKKIPVAEKVTLNINSLTMYTGDSHTLIATIEPADTFDKTLKWSSTNSNVASVDANGVVTATGYGKATITVFSAVNSAAKASCEINVYDHCTGIELSATSTHLYTTESFVLTANALPLATCDGRIEWSVSNENVVRREDDGTIVALAAGTAEITAKTTDGGHTAKCTVTVETLVAVESVTMSEQSLTMYAGDNRTLVATVHPHDTSYPNLTWSSSDNNVATVDDNGAVVAVGYGKATISAICESNTAIGATCEITVYEHCTGIELSGTFAEVMVGDNFYLSANTLPLGKTDGMVEWSVSDENIVKRNEDGSIVALSEGVAEVIAQSVDGGHTAKCTVTVKTIPVAKTLTLSDESLRMYVEDSHTLIATVLPEDATDKTVVWLSSDEKVTSVANGEVKAVGAGKANVIAFVSSNNAVADTCSIVVYEHTQGIKLSATEVELLEGSRFVLLANTLPLMTSDGEMEWSISDETIIRREEDGTIVTLKPGIADVIVTSVDGGHTAKCTVTVMPYIEIESISLDEQSLTMYAGDTVALTATVYPEDAIERELIWSTADSNVATVDAYGNVTAVDYGVTTITATSATHSDISASCEIMVYARCTGIELSVTYIKLYVGDSFTPVAYTLPFEITDGLVEWSVSDETIIKRNEDGSVVALSQGNAEVTAQSVDGGHIATCEVEVNKDLGIESILSQGELTYKIYNLQGVPMKALQKGINLVIFEDGTSKKIMVK